MQLSLYEKMSTFCWKNLLKCLPTTTTPSPHQPSPLSHDPLPSSTTPDPTTIIIKNFNSLYDLSSASTSKSLTSTTNSFSSFHSDSDADSPPDFATIYASQRFFFSSPGRSNSIIESPDTPRKSHRQSVSGGVAVKKCSPDPYTDFKHSMQEMIEARELRDLRADWDYLHELLSCYLTLNPKHTHKFIISAFADIVICLLSSSSPESDTHRKPEDHQRRYDVSRWWL